MHADGIVELIKSTGVGIAGSDVVIIGRSMIVGKPLAAMITNENGTVTLCHSQTRDLARVAARADILIAAMGRPGFVGPEFVKDGAVVIDVGSNAVSDPSVVREVFGRSIRREKRTSGKKASPGSAMSAGRSRKGRLADAFPGRGRAPDHRFSDEEHLEAFRMRRG